MATEMWITIEKKHCDLIGLDVLLEEKRVFPVGRVHEMGCYLTQGCRCSADVACNLAGIPCRWAYTNPDMDRFDTTA